MPYDTGTSLLHNRDVYFFANLIGQNVSSLKHQAFHLNMPGHFLSQQNDGQKWAEYEYSTKLAIDIK